MKERMGGVQGRGKGHGFGDHSNVQQTERKATVHSTKYLPSILNTAKVMKNKESLRNGHRPEEAKET